MSVVTIAEAWPAARRPFTVAELDRMPDDGRRYELLAGAPGQDHDGRQRGPAAIAAAAEVFAVDPSRIATAIGYYEDLMTP
jgi:hypothetical protein